MPTPFLLNGILASQISGHLYSGPAGAFDALGSVTVGSGGQSSITFSAIPNTYTDLEIRTLGRTVYAANSNSNVSIFYNGDTTATNYYSHYLYGTGSAAGAAANNSALYSFQTPDDSVTTNVFGAAISVVKDYANPNKNTTLRSLSGYDGNGSGIIAFTSTGWTNTTPVNSLTITAQDGSWKAGTTISLYGVK